MPGSTCLAAARLKSLDGFAISSKSKLPFKALLYREALLLRAVQLGKSAFESFEKEELASAILLTRATVETSAAIWYLRTKLGTAVQSKTADNIDENLMKLLMSGKADIIRQCERPTRLDSQSPSLEG